ncbi:hypothetical protein DH2020_031136 [Rehmannia glutinosa]|uniref:Cytochrome b561 domain-containing protein n=1 Tax=Rehmannia glutinosa TaxID=99300 RepID=A0ABR0VIV3_REHGL
MDTSAKDDRNTWAEDSPITGVFQRDDIDLLIVHILPNTSDNHLVAMLHPVLMLIGLIIIGGEGNCDHELQMPAAKEAREETHTSRIACYCSYTWHNRIYTAFKFHNESNIANLYSLHSWLGIGVISLYGIQWLYGLVVFFYPGGTTAIRSESLPWHVLFGIFVYVLAVATATLGYLEKLTFLESSGLAKYGSEAFSRQFYCHCHDFIRDLRYRDYSFSGPSRR